MDRNNPNYELKEPLLLSRDSSGVNDDEFYEAHQSSGSIPAYASSPVGASVTQSHQNNMRQTTRDNNMVATQSHETTAASTVAQASYFGKVSPLSTGCLFPSSRGIVDSLPHPSKPCLLFSDSDPLAAAAYICLLEKEVDHLGGVMPTANGTQLFTIVHVCEALAGKEDVGMRLLNKINHKRKGIDSTNSVDESGKFLELPVLLHEGNSFQEGMNAAVSRRYELASLLPEYIDGTIGKKNLLRPDDAVGLYNMKLFLQRYKQLPGLFHKLLTHPSPSTRIELSKQLLNLLKQINSDLQEGPYLCGKQFTLADICIFPIIERIVVVLSAYRNFWIPPSLTNLIAWYDTVADRPAVRVATADRTLESQNTYPYERIHRNEYLIEVYEPYARHEERMFKELNEQRGRPGENVYRQEVEEDMRDKRICERSSICQKPKNVCVIS